MKPRCAKSSIISELRGSHFSLHRSARPIIHHHAVSEPLGSDVGHG
jgi:hypothetical protein